MAQTPETKYAWNGDVALAYQVFGDGPVDLVYLQGWTSHVDLNWESPALSRFLHGLGRLARVIHTDRRGWGCSDRFSPGDVAPLEVQADDLAAVMDAAGSEQAVIFGSWDTGPAAMLFAATYPERTAGLVLCDTFVTYCATDETPWMTTEEAWEAVADAVRATWGTRPGSKLTTPLPTTGSWSGSCRGARASVAPGALIAESRAFYRADVRGVLPSIHVPTLVVGDPHDGMFRLNARFIAERIPGSRLVEPEFREGAAWFHWYQPSLGSSSRRSGA